MEEYLKYNFELFDSISSFSTNHSYPNNTNQPNQNPFYPNNISIHLNQTKTHKDNQAPKIISLITNKTGKIKQMQAPIQTQLIF